MYGLNRLVTTSLGSTHLDSLALLGSLNRVDPEGVVTNLHVDLHEYKYCDEVT